MTRTPRAVPGRPFAIEPTTNVTMPDGIVGNALHHRRVGSAAQVTFDPGLPCPLPAQGPSTVV